MTAGPLSEDACLVAAARLLIQDRVAHGRQIVGGAEAALLMQAADVLGNVLLDGGPSREALWLTNSFAALARAAVPPARPGAGVERALERPGGRGSAFPPGQIPNRKDEES